MDEGMERERFFSRVKREFFGGVWMIT